MKNKPSNANDKGKPPHHRQLFILGSIVFVSYVATNMRLPLVPLHASALGVTTAQIGIINAAYYLTACLMSLPLSFLSNTIGTKTMACSGLCLICICSFALCISDTFYQFSAVYACYGLGLAAFLPTMMAFVAAVSPAAQMGKSYGWFTTAQYVGMGLGPAAGGLLAQQIGFIQTFIIMGTIGILSFGWSVFALPAQKKRPPRSPGKTTGGFFQLFQNRRLVTAFLATIANCFALGMFMTFLPLHAKHQGLNVKQIGWLFLIQGIVNAATRIPMGNLADKVSDRRHLVVGGGCVIGLALAGIGFSSQFTTFFISAIVLGLGMAATFTAVGSLIGDSAPPGQRSLAMGCYNTCIFFGLMISSAFMGGVIEQIGFSLGFLFSGAGMLLLLFIPK